MSKHIERAIRDCQAAIKPEAVHKALGHRVPITTVDIRAGAAMALQDVLAEEIAR